MTSSYGPYVLDPYFYANSTNKYVYNESKLYFLRLINTITVVIVGSSLCLFLYYLILKKSPIHFRLYRKMLLLSAMMDTYMILVSGSFQMRQKTYNGLSLITFTGLFSYLGFDAYCTLTILQNNLAVFATSILPVEFYYRYYTVTRDRAPSLTQMVCWFLLSASLCLLPAYFVWETFCPAEKNPDHIDYGQMWLPENPLPPLIVRVPPKETSTYKQFTRSSLITFYFLIGLLFARLTVKAMNEKFSSIVINTTVQRVQRQLSRTLLIQLFIPIFLAILPTVLPVLAVHLNFTTEYSGEIIYILANYHPIFNLLTTIIFIEPYRRFCIRQLPCSKTFNWNHASSRIFYSSHTKNAVTVLNR